MSDEDPDEPDLLDNLQSQGWRDKMFERLVVATERQAHASEQISAALNAMSTQVGATREVVSALNTLSSQLGGFGDGVRVHVTKVGL